MLNNRISIPMFVLLLLAWAQQVLAADNGKVCLDGNCEDGWGTASFGTDEIYIGEFKGGLREGLGTLTNGHPQQGYQYSGEWKDNNASGTGFFLSDKMMYWGDFSNNGIQGKGIKWTLREGSSFRTIREAFAATNTFINDYVEESGTWENGNLVMRNQVTWDGAYLAPNKTYFMNILSARFYHFDILGLTLYGSKVSASLLPLPEDMLGLLVESIESDSPLYEAGIRAGDKVTSIDHNLIYDAGIGNFERFLQSLPQNHLALIAVEKEDGAKLNVQALLNATMSLAEAREQGALNVDEQFQAQFRAEANRELERREAARTFAESHALAYQFAAPWTQLVHDDMWFDMLNGNFTKLRADMAEGTLGSRVSARAAVSNLILGFIEHWSSRCSNFLPEGYDVYELSTVTTTRNGYGVYISSSRTIDGRVVIDKRFSDVYARMYEYDNSGGQYALVSILAGNGFGAVVNDVSSWRLDLDGLFANEECDGKAVQQLLDNILRFTSNRNSIQEDL